MNLVHWLSKTKNEQCTKYKPFPTNSFANVLCTFKKLSPTNKIYNKLGVHDGKNK
jgi:hypothetical protein